MRAHLEVVGLGPCAAPWCDRPAVAYVGGGGPTYGPSPRLTVIAGERALALAQVDPLAVRCLDCMLWAVEATVQPAIGRARTCS